ncbi:MAG: hypothetical protein K6E47_17225 [Lachnospiraceae bacterium]|nr:hypothetical protein [Lachnospiraceae bacterium]
MKLDTKISKDYVMKLYDGVSDGLIQIDLKENVTCYKLSKEYFKNYEDDDDIKKKKSVYILYGKGKFYIGQAGMRKNDTAITSRIKEHIKNQQRDFFEEIVFFCDSSNTWDGGELDYLEASLINYFKEKGFPLDSKQRNETIDRYLDLTTEFRYKKHLQEILIMIDILGYDAIRQIVNGTINIENRMDNTDNDALKNPCTTNGNVNSNSISSVKLTIEKYQCLMNARKQRAAICKEFLIDWGIEIDVECFNFASYSNKNKYYWMEPSKNVLNEKWMFVLYDDSVKQMDLFCIPEKTFTYIQRKRNSLIIRKDKPQCLRLEIDKEYTEKLSEKNLSDFLVKKLCIQIV